jgi:hypothetical protein
MEYSLRMLVGRAAGRAWFTEIIQPNVINRDMMPVMKKTLKPGRSGDYQ